MKLYLKQIPLLIALFAMMIACSDDIDQIIMPEQVIERIDLKISGHSEMYVYEQSLQNKTENDLVDYNYHGPVSTNFDILIQLEDGYELKVRMYNIETINLTEEVGIPYDLFVTQDLDDKTKYVRMDVKNMVNEEAPLYTNSIVGNHGATLNAFSITSFDYPKKEILCRVNQVELRNNVEHEKTILINGTFKGAITF